MSVMWPDEGCRPEAQGGDKASEGWGQGWHNTWDSIGLLYLRPEADDERAACDVTVRRMMTPSMESGVQAGAATILPRTR